jgi:hypothetical protein
MNESHFCNRGNEIQKVKRASRFKQGFSFKVFFILFPAVFHWRAACSKHQSLSQSEAKTIGLNE